MSNNGMTIEDVRSKVIRELRNNHISQSKLDELAAIFDFGYLNKHAQNEELIRKVSSTRDPICLEEVARVVLNPWMCYDGSSGYYVYGA